MNDLLVLLTLILMQNPEIRLSSHMDNIIFTASLLYYLFYNYSFTVVLLVIEFKIFSTFRFRHTRTQLILIKGLQTDIEYEIMM